MAKKMEAFTPPPYREKRPRGRQPIHSVEMRLMIGKKVIAKELTYREAAKTFGLSSGAVAACVRLVKNDNRKGQRKSNYHRQNDEVESYRHQAQIKDLKYQIADLFLENQMLKKIVAHSLEMKRNNGSIITTENLGSRSPAGAE